MSGGASLSALGLAALLALGACAPGPMGPGGGAKAGVQNFGHEGASFSASLAPGQAAVIISKDGARSAKGLSVSVSRSGEGLGPDSGRLAKVVAEKACTAAGGRFNAMAIGRYGKAGLWIFDGACT